MEDRLRLALVQLLLTHGAKVNVRDERGVRPIGYAARAQRWDMALLLLGIHVNAGV